MAPVGRPDHDSLYHRLFSHPGVVAELLRGFVAGDWLDEHDLDGLERQNAKLHADGGERRDGDMIWRIPRRDGEDSYLLLLLEFQSTSEHFMAVRVLIYAALLWQQLVRAGEVKSGGALPPVLPVVLYNGDARWRAPVAIRDLVALPQGSSLWRWQPDISYYLIDAGSFTDADLAARDGLPALWFRLESADDPAAVTEVAEAVLAWLAGHPEYAAMRAVFAEFLAAMTPRPGADVPMSEEWMEMQSRLLARAKVWTEAWRLEGVQEGLQQGRQLGHREGRQQGEAALLLRLMEHRFGTLPEPAITRVRAADIAELEQWGLRVLGAESLDDVFRERRA